MSQSLRLNRTFPTVSHEVCIERALAYGRGKISVLTSDFAYVMWPGRKFLNNQGAALAASRIVGIMRQKDLITPVVNGHGWTVTPIGHRWTRTASAVDSPMPNCRLCWGGS